MMAMSTDGRPRFDGRKDASRRKTVEARLPTRLMVLRGVAPENNLEWGEYRKTTPTFAVRMSEPFEVDTLEGLHEGKAGDYLAIGAAGEMYPIDAAVFATTYERVDRPEPVDPARIERGTNG